MSIACIPAFAQSSVNANSPQYIAITNQMKTQLNLTSAQVQQVQQINQTLEEQTNNAMQQLSSNKVETNNTLITIRSNYLNQLQAVLTQDQWEIYTNSKHSTSK
jgi:hypothetical protein